MTNNVDLLNRLATFVGGFGFGVMLSILVDSWGKMPVYIQTLLLVALFGAIWITWDSLRGKLGTRRGR